MRRLGSAAVQHDRFMTMISLPLIAVDIGNARMKLGLFGREHVGGLPDGGLPEPQTVLALEGRLPQFGRLGPWLNEIGQAQLHWFIGSVNRPTVTRLLDWLRSHRPADPVRLLAAGDLPLEVRLKRPDTVGIDRLLDALAANRLRQPDRPAVVVDLGTAVTIDLVDRDGVFLGGSILPGIEMSARALHDSTDLLPKIEMAELTAPPPVLGTSTVSAMRSGLFWGAVGAIREVAEQLGIEIDEQIDGRPQIFLTGGAGPIVAQMLGKNARHVPQLTLGGIALAAGV